MLTRNFTQSWLHPYWLSSVSQTNVLDAKTACILWNLILVCPFFPHACCYWLIFIMFDVKRYAFRGFKSMRLEFDICQTKLWNQFFLFSVESLTLAKMDWRDWSGYKYWKTCTSLFCAFRRKYRYFYGKNVSIPRLCQELGLSYGILWRILHLDVHLHPYKVQLTQHLKPADHSQRRRYVKWVLGNFWWMAIFRTKFLQRWSIFHTRWVC